MPGLKRARASSEHASSDEGSSSSDVSRAPWPASETAIEKARSFIKDCAKNSQLTLIVPDKDTDGLSSGVIMHRTLVLLGHDPANLHVHLLSKGTNPHTASERDKMAAYGAEYAIFVDHGSRGGPALVPPKEEGGPLVKTLLLDHHLSDDFPEGAEVVSAARFPPIATSATLTYHICKPLHPSVEDQCDYLCAMGTHGDLGTAFKWEAPFPDMKPTFKKYTKKAVNEAVSLVNGPRRTSKFDVISAWDALLASTTPSSILKNPRLLESRREIAAEVERCTHTAPIFSADGRVALLRLTSGAQVHPLIATRWASNLKGKGLQIVMAANDGYLPGMTNFACRVARSAFAAAAASKAKASPKKGELAPAFKKFKKEEVVDVNADKSTENTAQDAIAGLKGDEASTPGASNDANDDDISIPAILESYASLVPGLRQEMGDDYARGHAHASGGIVRTELFERLWGAMCAKPTRGEGEEGGASPKKNAKTKQKNTLEGWVKKK